MRGKEHSVPGKITSCPAPWVIPEGFLRSGSCLRPWARRDTRVFSFLASPQLKREVCRADKLGFWRQETLFRNNVPFPAAQECQTYGCFWFRRSSRAHFLPRPHPPKFSAFVTPVTPQTVAQRFPGDHVFVVSSQGRRHTRRISTPLTESKIWRQRGLHLPMVP